MKNSMICKCGLLLSVGALWCSTIAAADVVLVNQGQPKAAIFVEAAVMAPEKKPVPTLFAENRTETERLRLQASVRDLSDYLKKISGAEVPIVAAAPAADEKRLPILIGSLATKTFGAPQKSFPYQQGFRVVVSPKGIGLSGESDLATSYAVYEVLHKLGCRWYMPGPMGDYFPTATTIALPEGDTSTGPATIYRGIWYADDDYKRRNRQGGLLLNAGHALEFYMPKDELKKHPEWVGTVDGKPNLHRLKWSAPGLPEFMANLLIAQLDKNAVPSMSLSPDDGLGYDNSKEDQALDAGDFDPAIQMVSITDRQVLFCNKIIERVVKKYPKVLFGMLAYGQSTRPPVREKLHPNLIPQIAPITFTRVHPMTDDGEPNNKDYRFLVEAWGKASPTVSYYLYGFNLAEVASPCPMLTKWAVDVPIIYRNNCKFWQPETLTNFETCMHIHYMGLRMAWDPTQKPTEIYAEINRNFYGAAGSAMADYWTFVDSVWVDTPEYSGCGFGHLRRFTPDRMAKIRELLDKAKAACKTDRERFNVGVADDSLKQFELFIKLRRDLAEGRFANIAADAKIYTDTEMALGKKYIPQHCFGRMGYTGESTINNSYFNAFYNATYTDADRVAKNFDIVTKSPVRVWKWQQDKEAKGESAGWSKPELDDKDWKSTDVAVDTWSALGMHNYMGAAWYRQRVDIPAAAAGKKTYLWVGATDGRVKVFVNGKAIDYKVTDSKTGEVKVQPHFEGYCQPASFDITEALRPGENSIALGCTRTFLNELGTGGLIAPVVIYRDK